MTIEICTFRLAPGADEATFAEADARLQQEFVYQQAGALRRTTARDEAGEWAVVTLWRTADDAEAATARAAGDPVATSWRSLVEASSVSTKCFEALA